MSDMRPNNREEEAMETTSLMRTRMKGITNLLGMVVRNSSVVPLSFDQFF